MVIAIDYDETWTADPALFASFADMARAAGHTPIIVTGRGEERRPVGLPLPVYCTGGRAKRWYMLEVHQMHVDVMVDDTPEWWDRDA